MTKRLRESYDYTYLGKNDNHEEHHPLPPFIKKNELFSIWKLLVWIPINGVKGMLQEYLGSDKDVCINIILLFIFFEERLHTAFHFISGGSDRSNNNRGTVFGGFVRDLISGNVFNDVDIYFNEEKAMHKFVKKFNSKYDTTYEMKNLEKHNIKTKYMHKCPRNCEDSDIDSSFTDDEGGRGHYTRLEKEYTLLSRISGCFVKKSEINNSHKIEIKFDLVLLNDMIGLLNPRFCRDFSCNGLILTHVLAIEKPITLQHNIFELSNPNPKKRRFNSNSNSNNDYFPFSYNLTLNPLCNDTLRIHDHIKLCRRKIFMVYDNNGNLSADNHHWRTYGEQCIESNTDYGKILLVRLKSMKRKGFICEQTCKNEHCILYNLNKI